MTNRQNGGRMDEQRRRTSVLTPACTAERSIFEKPCRELRQLRRDLLFRGAALRYGIRHSRQVDFGFVRVRFGDLRSLGALIFLEVLNISKKALTNEEIKAKEVRVINAQGEQIGILSIEKALRLASESGLDLVEIAPEGKPPVCKIMDFGKYRFEREKREKEIRKNQQTAELKELQLTCNIGLHDFNTKLNHALRFLGAGNKVKVIVKFRGREMAHPERGTELLGRFSEAVGELGAVEKVPTLDGRNMIMVLAPKKSANTSKGKDKNGQDQNS